MMSPTMDFTDDYDWVAICEPSAPLKNDLEGDTTMGSTSDKISGKANELTGQARQAVGDATDNRSMQAKGAAQEAKGDAQQAKGEAKDAVKRVVDKH